METNRVYVGNIAYNVYWYDLKDFMKSAGEVVHANVLRSHNGQSRGCGIVEFATPEDAQRAIDTLNNAELKGRPVFIREDREAQHASGGSTSNSTSASSGTIPTEAAGLDTEAGAPSAAEWSSSPHPPSASAENSAAKHASSHPGAKPGFAVFVGNLPFSVTWQQLKQLFCEAGEVVRADIHMTPQRRSRGHGTVVFLDEATAQKAIQQFNGYSLQGRTIEVREDKPASERPAAFLWCTGNGEPSEVVHVSNLPWTTTDEDLVELFQSIAPLSRAHLQNFPDGRFSGCGVVRYESQASAELAVAQLNGYKYGSCDLYVSYARYPPPQN